MRLFSHYFLFMGVLSHVLVIVFFALNPIIFGKVTDKVINTYYQWQKNKSYKELTQGISMSLEEEITSTFTPWQPQHTFNNSQQFILINERPFIDLDSAIKNINDGDTVIIPEGIYQNPIKISRNDVTIRGNGHVIFEKGAADNKGFILSEGRNLTVENIECRHITVGDGNGACIRQEGVNLTLNHVYFHNSQEGILETSNANGFIKIYDSRFERLGNKGQSHGVYTNKADLYIYNSLFVGTKSEGHAIKVRGKLLYIEDSIITSLSANDSRLIDMPNGGELIVKGSTLAQGPNSSNAQAIGIGLEGIQYKNNSVSLTRNIIYLERIGVNKLLALPQESAKSIHIIQNKNIIIGEDHSNFQDSHNTYFDGRNALGIERYPYLPKEFCMDWCVGRQN